MTDAAAPLPLRKLTLLVVRHGITEWNAVGRLQGQSDIPLAPTGREQARLLGRRFGRLWQNPSALSAINAVPPVAVYTSDLSRARETTELLLAESKTNFDIPIRVTSLLRERGFGDWEGLTEDEARVRFGNERNYRNEGESHEAVRQRMKIALAQIWAETMEGREGDAVVLIVGHGGSLRQLVCVTSGFGIDEAHRFHLDNTGLSVIELRGPTLAAATGRIRLWNDTAHLLYESE